MSFGEFTESELATEGWREIPGLPERFAGQYQASSLGRVRRLRPLVNGGVSIKFPQTWISKRGYRNTHIATKHYLVHRLVAAAFHGPCPDDQECRHLDGNKLNCRPTNLAWGTRQQNNGDKALYGWRRPVREAGRKRWCLWLSGRRINLGYDKDAAYEAADKILAAYKPGEPAVIPDDIPRPVPGRPRGTGRLTAKSLDDSAILAAKNLDLTALERASEIPTFRQDSLFDKDFTSKPSHTTASFLSR